MHWQGHLTSFWSSPGSLAEGQHAAEGGKKVWVAMCSGLAWKVTLVPHHIGSWPTPLQPSPPSLSACLRACVVCVVWLFGCPAFDIRHLRGREGAFPRLRSELARRRRAHNNTHRRARHDAIATGLKPDLLPRSGLCSPSSMAQAEPSMASGTYCVVFSVSPARPWTSPRPLSFATRPGLFRELSHSHPPPSRSSSSSRYLSRVAVCGERPCR